MAIILLIPKSGDCPYPTNYCPIVFVPVLSKLPEIGISECFLPSLESDSLRVTIGADPTIGYLRVTY